MAKAELCELLNTTEAARLCGLAPHTLENLRHRGGGSRFIKHARKVLYDPEDLRAWLDARKVSSTSEVRARKLHGI